eukprot:gene36479-biopygen6912
MGLERPIDRDADATFLRQMCRLNHLREAIWEERRHMLDPSTRSWSDELPTGSKWFVLYRGHACGVYADYDLTKAQIFQVQEGKLRGFPDEAAAGAAEHLRLALELQRERDRVHAEGTALISVYTDGSYSKAEPSLHTPSKAGWAFLAVPPTDDRVLCQRNNFLMLDPDDLHYHDATHKSNNTGEVTAIGEALAWIHQQPTDPAICYDICSDSYYGIDEVDVMPGRDSSRTSAPGSGERFGRPPTTRVPPGPPQQRLQRGLTAHPPAPDAEADKSDTGTACERPGSPDPDQPGTQDTKNRVGTVTWADRVHPHTTHNTRLVRQKRDGAERFGPDITASKEEPTAEVHLDLNPRADGASTHGPAFDPSIFGRPAIARHTGSHLLCPPTPPAPTGREDSGGILPGPERSGTSGRQGKVLGPAGHRSPFSLGGVGAAAYWPQDNPPTDGVGPAAPTNRAGGARKRRGDGETRRPFERKVATR